MLDMPRLIKQWKKVSRPLFESPNIEVVVLTLEDRWESEAGRSSRNKGYAEDGNRAAKVCSCTNTNLYEYTLAYQQYFITNAFSITQR